MWIPTAVLPAVSRRPLTAASGTLDIHFSGVESGQATLIVSPSGESLLVEAGRPGFDGRDADHYTPGAGEAGNVQDKCIANLVEDCRGRGLSLSAQADGAFTVTNERNGYRETCEPGQP